MGYIYKITNMITKKMYIGQTVMELQERWRCHKKSNSNCVYLLHALNKYGICNFKFELICICFDENMIEIKDEYMIRYNTMVPNGYNVRAAGNIGRHSEETKRKISNTLTGRSSPLKGKPGRKRKHTEEEKRKISESMKGKKQSVEAIEKRSKGVIKYDSHGNELCRYKSVKDAAEDIGVSKAAISRVCNGKQKTTKLCIFKFV